MKSLSESWCAVVAYAVRNKYLSSDYLITFYPDYRIGDFPGVAVESNREGGTLSPGGTLRDSFCLYIIRKAKAEWFIPFLERLGKGEEVPIWEIAREYELHNHEPMVVMPPEPPGSLDLQAYCCDRYYLSPASPKQPETRLPLDPRIRDSGWRAIITCQMTPQTNAIASLVVYYSDYYNGQPGILLQAGTQGILAPAACVLQDPHRKKIIEDAGAGWFLPYVERVAQGQRIAMWELHREIETRLGHPMHVLPPGIFLDDRYCQAYFRQDQDQA